MNIEPRQRSIRDPIRILQRRNAKRFLQHGDSRASQQA
jgi:hypothetical protein